MEPFGPDSLDPFQLVDIRADLEDRAGLDVAGELGVGDLVVERTPDRRPVGVVHAEQEVGVTAPRPIEERGLVDDVGSGRHGRDGRGGGLTELVAAILDRAVEVDPDDASAFGLELREVALLVLEASLADDIELGIGPHRPVDETGHRRPLERGQMLAGEIGDQVRGGVDGPPVDRLHDATLAAGRVSLPVATPAALRLGPCRIAIPSAPTRPSRRANASARRWSSARSGRRSRRAASTRFRTRAAACRSRMTRRQVIERWPIACSGTRASRRAGSKPTRPFARSWTNATDCSLGRRACRQLARPRAREEMRRLVEAANRAILRVNIEAPTDRQQRRSLDLEVELARFERATEAASRSRATKSRSSAVRRGRLSERALSRADRWVEPQTGQVATPVTGSTSRKLGQPFVRQNGRPLACAVLERRRSRRMELARPA